jgi:hypothetical protein
MEPNPPTVASSVPGSNRSEWDKACDNNALWKPGEPIQKTRNAVSQSMPLIPAEIDDAPKVTGETVLDCHALPISSTDSPLTYQSVGTQTDQLGKGTCCQCKEPDNKPHQRCSPSQKSDIRGNDTPQPWSPSASDVIEEYHKPSYCKCQAPNWDYMSGDCINCSGWVRDACTYIDYKRQRTI